jgi:hypothetical protein
MWTLRQIIEDRNMSDQTLTPDAQALREFEKKMHVVRDLVTAVAKNYQNGLYLFGSGGVGNSYNVLKHLENLGIAYRLFNGRMTAKGLFLSLQNAPDAVHVLEDMERLTRDGDAQGVLRSALWAQPGHDRVVTWTTATDGAMRFTFRGGLILISNCPLGDLPELRALATRIQVHRFEVTDAELVALMRKLAGEGYQKDGRMLVTPEEYAGVTEYLLDECRSAGCPLDLRLQLKTVNTYLQWHQKETSCHWRDLVAVSVREASHHFRHEVDLTSREGRIAQKQSIVREIIRKTGDPKEQELMYRKKTQASRADFFRRKREVEDEGLDVASATEMTDSLPQQVPCQCTPDAGLPDNHSPESTSEVQKHLKQLPDGQDAQSEHS